MNGDTNQSMDDDSITQHNLPMKSKKVGGDADSGNSDKEEEENYTDNGLDNEQPEDTDTRLPNQQKKRKQDEVSHQSDEEQEDHEIFDWTSIQDQNDSNEVPHAGEGPRSRRPNSKQKIDNLGKEDISDYIEQKRSPSAGDTSRRFILPMILLSLTALVGVTFWFLQDTSLPLQKESNILEVFCEEIDKVQASFPGQHHELWRRSRIHLQKHLNLTNPTEPVSLILTSGRRAEKTLGCLAQKLAAAFSRALNSSVLDIYGTSKSAQDSDKVKLDIDNALTEGFQGDKQAAVIHRFEEIPPGSTLIFYRYCDHENAAFKKVFLAFTVMLQVDTDFSRNISLGIVEEVVQEYLQEKFVSTDKTAKFNQMDLDKLSGLWSRISHLILPVVAEQDIEQHGC